MTKTSRAAASYFRGKGGAGVYQRLINQISPHLVYVEACLGGGAVLRHKRSSVLNIGIDRDGVQVERFRRSAVNHQPGSFYFLEQCGVKFLQQAFSYREGLPMQDGLFRFAGYAFDAAKTFVYLDPPYPLQTRKSGERYLFEWDTYQHLELLRVVQKLPCMVMVSSYPNEMYAESLSEWRTFTFSAATRKGVATEQVWCNFPEPTALHDYRYLGGERREREKLNRRVRTILSRMNRLSPIERNALLAAMLTGASRGMGREEGSDQHWILNRAGAEALPSERHLADYAESRDWPMCRMCGEDFLIGESGLLCSNGCGSIKPLFRYFSPEEYGSIAELRLAFPERCVG